MKKHVVRCISALLAGALGAFITLSLITYYPTDHSVLFSSLDGAATQNKAGTVGAAIAGLLFYFFGVTAYLIIPIFLFAMGMILGIISVESSKDRLLALLAAGFLVPIYEQYSGFMMVSGIYPGGYIGYYGMHIITALFDPVCVSVFIGISAVLLFVLIDGLSSIYLVRRGMQAGHSLLYRLLYHTHQDPQVNTYVPGALITGVRRMFALFQVGYQAIMPSDAVPEEDTIINEVTHIFNDPFWADPSLHAKKKSYQVRSRTNKELAPKESPINNVHIAEEEKYQFPYRLFEVTKDELLAAKKSDDKERDRATQLENKLHMFGINGSVTSIMSGPVVTLFEYSPSPETKISTILAREDDLALALEALSLRIIAPIPGKSVVGFEVAHRNPEPVLFQQLLVRAHDHIACAALPLLLGTDTQGSPVIADLVKLPHLLLAGTTGSGKSVAVQNMLMTLLCHKSPQELKLILIDPKRLELSVYQDVGHLLFPVIIEPKKALLVLRWATEEMERRYTKLAESGVKNCVEYHELDEQHVVDMPFIVIVIDELADLMMTAGKDLEIALVRLAQMARASGIHLITATQRPSVDVVTGLIKVNFPSRLACKVASKIDSRTILDSPGAEKLLGRGDMLFLNANGNLQRLHGAYVTSDEIEQVADAIRAQSQASYEQMSLLGTTLDGDSQSIESKGSDEALFEQAREFVKTRDEVSISLIQRVFKIGYNRSARIIEQLEESGYVLPPTGSKKRKVNIDRDNG